MAKKSYKVLRHHLGDKPDGATVKQHMFAPAETRELEPAQATDLVTKGVLEELPGKPAAPKAARSRKRAAAK